MFDDKILRDPNPLGPGIYKTDAFNMNPLFEVNSNNIFGNERSYFVRSWEEAFAIHGKLNFECINPEYICSFITRNLNSQISPFKRIKRISRNSKITISDNSSPVISRFDPFDDFNEELNSSDFYKIFKKRFIENLSSSIEEDSKIAIEPKFSNL